jgi:hypothetical protein
MPLVRSTPVTSGFASRDIYGTVTSLVLGRQRPHRQAPVPPITPDLLHPATNHSQRVGQIKPSWRGQMEDLPPIS